MDKKYLKWTLIVAYGLIIIGLFGGGLLYLSVPFIISALTPYEGGCEVAPSSGGHAKIAGALSELCYTSQTFVGALMMIPILLGGFFIVINTLLSIIDAFQSKMSTGKKIIWISAMLLVSFPTSTIYYLVKKRS